MNTIYPSLFKSNRIGHIFQAGISGVFFSICTWLLIISVSFANIPQYLVNSILIVIGLFSFAVLLISILRLLKPIPELEYLESGFNCKVGTSTRMQIKWEEVEDLAFVSGKKEQVLAVMLKRPSSAIRPFRGWASVVMKARLKNYGTPVILSAKRLNISLEDLKSGFVYYWNQYRHTDQ